MHDYTFANTSFSGRLILSNVNELEWWAFYDSGFSGELIIPEGITEIPIGCFLEDGFTSVVFPSSLRVLKQDCFRESKILEPLVIPEGTVGIEQGAFYGCSFIPSLSLPSTLNSIAQAAFSYCSNISSIKSLAIEPPSLQSNVFEGVAKDNFTIEVPSQSIKRYQAEPGWSDFKRIAAQYDFAISRSEMQALNGENTRTLTLRVPSGFNWSIREKPDWVTVEPSSGVGKTDVIVTVSAMARTNDTFEVNEGSFNNPSYVEYKGRSGEVVFLLDDKEYTSTLTVEQYDADYADGAVQTLQTHTQGTGINIVITGDGYSARDISKGTFQENAAEAYGHFFDVEPYKTYKDYFNVYTVP